MDLESKFNSVLNFFTSPNATYNKLKSKERVIDDEEADTVPVIS